MITENLRKEIEKKHKQTSGNESHKIKMDGNEDGKKKLDTRFQTSQSITVNVDALENELKETISGEVRFDDGSKALYSTDASNYRQIPLGVVLPKTEEDIINTIKACKKYAAPVLSRGGGTSLAGQCCNVAVVMDMSKYYNKVLN